MNTTVKVISVDGDVWRFSNTNKKLILKKGAKLQAKDVLHLSEESNVVLQLSNGRVVEIHGKDLINNDGNFSLNSLLVQSNSDIDKIVNFAKSFQQMNESEQQNDVVRLDDGRVFKKEGKDYVEIAGESFEGDPDVTQGGHRFVQLTRAGETSVADGIKPLMLNRVVDNIPPLGIQYPILSSVIKPFEHGLGGGSWMPLSVSTLTGNTPPAAVNDSYTTPHNTPVVLNPLQGDTDPENDALSITSINGVTLTPGTAQSIPVTNGVVTVAADGTITFTPNTGFVGQVSFPYTISDGHGGTSQAIETITITNTAPAAVNDNYTTPHNTPVVLNPLQGDTDPENDALSITSINGVTLTPGTAQSIPVTNGVVTVAADGTITFTPNTGFVGQVSFPYTISDGHGGTSQAIETITITNTAPAAVNDNYTTPHNTPVVLNPLQGDTDPENDALSITSINGVTLTPGTAQSIPVTNGVVTVAADGTITFTPNTGFVGQVSFPYTISDGHGGTSQAIETITITNTAPAAVNDNYTTPHNTPVVLNPLQGDTDPENDALSITSINGVTLTPGTAQSIPVTNGVVTVAADGTITFTPNTGFVGQVSFPYTISDGHGGTSQAIETITITNTAPAAVNDNYTTPHNTPVVLNPLQGDTDPENDALSITSINGVTLTPGTAQSIPVTNGVVTVAADGTITFTPNTGFVGQVSFPYTISDGHGGTSQAIETITITNTAPAAVNDNYTTPHNTPVVLNPLQGDTDPENDALSITSINGVTLTPGTAQSIPVTNGVVTVAADGTITFTPNTGFVGQVSFPYTISDGHGGTSQAIETITITNTAPAAVNDNYTTPHNTPVVLNPLQGDTDPENDALSITSINGVTLTPGTAQSIPVTNGVVTVAADGTITFTPNTGFVGQVSFPYTISDGHGGTSQAIETITITNTAPELTSGSARVSEEGLVGGLADSNGNDLANSRTFSGSLVGADVDSDAVLTYAFTAAPSDVLTSKGVAVVWTLVSATEVVGTANGIPVVSVVLISATGVYTVTLNKAVDHADVTQEDILDFTIPTRVTDNHGASDTSTLTVIVEDDSPVITPTNAANSLQVDETNFVSGSVSVTDINFGKSAFTVNYGADDAAVSNSLLYSLGVSSVGVSSALVDTATGQLVYLYIESGTGDVIGRVGSGGNPAPLGAEAFRIHVDATTGATTLTQKRPLNHSVDGATPAAHDDVLTLAAGAVRLTAVATDRDRDSDSQTVAVGDKFSFKDDGLSLTATATNLGTLQVDESVLQVSSPVTATNSNFLTNVFSPTYGTDGQHANPLVYSLSVASAGGVNSGLVDTATGEIIYLFLESGVVIGRVGSGGSPDLAGIEAIRISLAGGEAVTLSQSRAVKHPTGGASHDESIALLNGALSVRAVARDGDGDTAIRQVNIGSRLTFLDDGPAFISASPAPTVDEADLPLGSSPNAPALTQSGTLTINFGADKGTASQVDVQFTAATLTALENWDDTATGGEANNENLTFTISNAGHTITATDSVSGLPAFTVTLTVDKATGATSYQFVLSRALAHNNLSELHIPFNNLLITDGDGDTTIGNFSVIVLDDSPNPLVPINVSVYEDLYIPNGNLATNTFNTNADATSANTVVNNGVGGSPSVVTNVTVYVNGTAQVLPTAYETPHGYVVVQTNGQITYYPDPDFSGVDTFTYTTTTDDGAKTYTVNMTVTPVSNDHPEMGSNPDPVPANNVRCTNEDTRVDLNLVAPVIKDRTDQNGVTTGDNPERLGAITLTLTGLGAASNAPPAGVGVQHTNNGATLTKADGTPLVTNGSGGYTIVIVDTAGSTTPSASYHHAGVPAGDANVNYMTAAEYANINANPGLHRHENFNVNVSVTSYEVDATTGQVRTDVWGVRADGANADDALGVGATSTETITVTVRAVTDDASLGYNNNASGTAATGSSHTGGTDPTTYSVVYSTHTEGSNLNRPAAAVTLGEDKAINIKDILTANFADVDGSEVRTLTLENPAGSGGAIRYSTDGGANWIPLNAGDPAVTFNAKAAADGQTGIVSSFNDIRIAAPSNFAGDIGNTNKIKITIGAGDTDSDGAACGVPIAEADTTNNSVYLSLHVNPRAGDVRTSTVATIEDTPVAFLANIAVTDSSEVINSVSFTIPTGWRVLDPTSITTNADAGAGGNGWTANAVTPGGWSVSQMGSTYTISFNNGPTGTILTELQREGILDQFKILPPAHSSKDLLGSNLVLTINVTDSATVNGAPVTDTVNRTLNQTITVTPVAESLKLTGNATITGSTTDYYATAADNPANWIVRNTDGTAANANVDGGGTQDLTMNGNWNYDTHALEDTWFALNSDGFNFKGPWHNEDANTADINNPSSRVEQTFALLTAYEVVRNASGVIIGLNALPASEFQYNNGSVVTGNRIPAANLDTVSFKAPNGFSGEVWIKVQAVTVDYDADNGSASAEVTSGVAWLKDLLVEPVADDVTLQVNQREVMDEDTSRALTIRTQSTDTDTSETFNVKIAGIPLGAKMELGGHVFDTTVPSTWTHAGHTLVNNGGGSFTLELNGLPQGTINPIYTPPLHSNTNGTDTVLTVNAQAVDSKVIWDANALPPAFVTYTSTSPISSNQTIAISVIGVPDAPMLTIVQHQTWIENNLDEHNGGTNNATSSTQKNVVDLSNFITGISYGESTHPSHGGTDNSETITLRITGLPNGFDLVDAAGGPIVTLGGGNGTDRVWVITPADLATAKIKLPVNYSGTVKFDVEPVVTENDGRATIFAKQNVEFYVTPSPEATLNIESNVWEDVDNGTYGHAGQLGKLDLIANTVVNGDNLNEQIYAVRFNATQLAAEGITLYANAAGTTQLVAVGGFITVTGVTNVQSIYVRGPANFSGSKAITVEYIVADSTNDGTLGANQTIYTGGTNTLNWATHETINHTLNFRPVTDNVDMNINNINGGAVTNYTLNAAGTVTVNLGIAKAQDANAGNARDYDYTVANGGEHITHYLIEGVPEQGVSVQGAIYLGGGKWLMAASGENFTGSLTKNVIFNVNNHAGDINNHPITITTYTQDKNASVVTDSVTWNLTTNFPDGGIEPILPTLDIVPLNPNETEDTAFALSKAIALNSINFGSVNQPSYDLTITLRTYPGDNTSFSIGGTPLTSTVVIEGGVPVTVWTYTVSGVTNANAQAAVQNALNNILVTPATNANGNTNNLNDTLPLDVSVQFHSSGVTSGDRTTSEVTLAPVTDPAVLTITAPATDEGGIVPITINVGSAGGADKTGDWTIIGNNLYLQFSGTVIDGQLQDSLGNPIATVTNPAGLPAGTYYVVTGVTPNTPVQLRYAIEQDDSRYDHGSFTLNGWVRNQENGSTPLVSNGSAPIVINPVNSDPVITVVAHDDEHNGQGANAIGAVELNITKTVMPNDPQVGEQLYSAFIKGLPSGFTVYTGATAAGATLANNAGNGVWSIPTPGGVLPAHVWIKPPAYWSGTLDDLQLVLMSGETGLTATPHAIDFDLVVDPVANGISDFKPTYSFNQTGNTFTTLNLNIGMNDPVRVNNSAYDENAELTRLTLAGIPNAADSIFIANGAVIDASRITTVGSTITINGLTQAELDNLQLIHAPMARTQITANAQTYEVDAAGNTVDTSGWFGTRTFDLQITAGPTTGSGNLTGTAGNDTLIATGSSNTTLTGNAGHDILIGNVGNNTLNGGDDNDRLYGQGGNDTLNGGADNDILQGGTGSDSLTGGTGSDTFVWGANDIGLFATPDTDTITDFNLLGDKIDATALLTALGWNGNDATLSQFVSASGTTINIHDTANTKSVNIVVTGQSFADFEDMISKINFQH